MARGGSGWSPARSCCRLEELRQVYEAIGDRRSLLSSLAGHAGWRWSDLASGRVDDIALDRWALRSERPPPRAPSDH